tara:strand:+ start:350 stop:1522 length:1173 start_codon:yes stop_codon:yes gene_type:complete
MQLKNNKIVIIGSGMAAYMLAQNIRQESADIDITIIAERDGRFYPKPMLSTALFHKKTPSDIETASSNEMMSKYAINIMTNQKVHEIDRKNQSVILSEQTVHYDKLVLAVGSIANEIPNISPTDGYVSINAIEDYEVLLQKLDQAKKILVIGSGLVGVEFAHDLLQSGYEVSMVSQDVSALWPLIPREIGIVCRDHLISRGLDWFVDKGVIGLKSNHDQITVQFSEHPEKTYDLVLSAIGIKPRIELAKAANLDINLGIVTDAWGKTNDPNIYALGDCAEIHGLVLTYVAPIKQQALAIAKSLTGNKTKISYPPMPVVVKMPTFPLTLVPVRQVHPTGEWCMHQNDENDGLIAGFYHPEKGLQGFVLAGPATRLRNEWLKKMPESILDSA